jgi:hypothetical protein
LPPESYFLYLAFMRLEYFLAAVLLLASCGGRKISPNAAVKTIMDIPGETFKKEDIEVLNVFQVSGSEAVIETRLRTAFRMEKVGEKWVVREVRIGRGQWEKVVNLERALEVVRTEETRAMLEQIAGALLKYRASKGSLPVFKDYVSLSDLLSPAYLSPLIRLDAWRNPLEASPQDSNTILLRSAGPDGKFNTADDITKTVP